MNRRLYGFFTKRLDEAGLHQVSDSRGRPRQALDPAVLPFGVVSLYGKAFSLPASDD
jgi:hypothetical protein